MIAVRLSEVSLALATVALLIAVLSLYLGNLKRADIQMIWLSERHQWLRTHQRRDEGPPISAELPFSVVVINSGARPGVITGLDIDRREPPPPYVTIESCSPEPNFRDGATGALPLLSGESHALNIVVNVRLSDESVDAWRAEIFRTLDISVTYTYLKGRRLRPRATRTLKLSVPIDAIATQAES